MQAQFSFTDSYCIRSSGRSVDQSRLEKLQFIPGRYI
ncbi:Protein of unknown function [Bacillus wiedmannii]|uniref:Uncharacterized protein n=1 Tax=Bacillus wiedmannii TaxID=1890302 RepID=A0AB37YSS8_9BACI|nr:Protein of unknown function [Bacillus wiedmannii]